MNELIFAGDGLFNLLGSIGLMLAGYISNRYLIPFLAIGRRSRYAELITRIADEVTDELRTKYPERQWLAHLDEAIDSLIEILGISQKIALRAVRASAARK